MPRDRGKYQREYYSRDYFDIGQDGDPDDFDPHEYVSLRGQGTGSPMYTSNSHPVKGLGGEAGPLGSEKGMMVEVGDCPVQCVTADSASEIFSSESHREAGAFSTTAC